VGGRRRDLLESRARKLARPTAWGALARSAAWDLRRDCVPAFVPEPVARPVIEWPASYGHPIAAWFMRPLLRGFRHWATVVRGEMEQRGDGIVRCRAHHRGGVIEVAIDYLDLPRIEDGIAAEVDLYFKLQHAEAGYGRPNVVPGGYLQPRSQAYDHYCRLRGLPGRESGASVYGRFGTSYGASLRRQAIELLEGRPELGYDGGLKMVPYVQSLREAAEARVCVDLPGRGPFCYRLIDYLSVGACVVAAPHHARLQVELEDRRHIVYARDDLSDLPDLCAWLLEDDAARRRIQKEAGRLFERHLHYLPLTSYYVSTMLEALGSGQG